MFLKNWAIWLLLLLQHPGLFAQSYQPIPSDAIYNLDEVARIDISLSTEHLILILAPGNEYSDVEYPVTFQFSSSQLNVTEVNVGFRLRGNTSRVSAKKSFKISMNSFEKGRDLLGYEKLNLNGEHNDPSIIRSSLCWSMMQKLGIPAPRAGYAELYINGEYKGLYANIEHIDEEFAELRFDNKKGNLFKCLYPANLSFRGDDPNLYKTESNGRRMYELTTNEELDDYSGLANFIKVLNTPSLSYTTKLDAVFDVHSYLKALAIEALSGHWDNYGMNQNNYYLYENPEDGKFYYIPFDMDNTLGVDFIPDIDRTITNIYQWYDQNADRPLTEKLMKNSTYRQLFSIYLEQILNEVYAPELLFPEIDRIKAMITDAAERDPYKAQDWGFTNEDFHQSYEQAIPYFFIKEGLKTFIQKRYENTTDQLVVVGVQDEPTVSLYPNPFSTSISISAPSSLDLVICNSAGQMVFKQKALPLNWQWKGTNQMGQALPDGLYLFQISHQNQSKELHRVLLQH